MDTMTVDNNVLSLVQRNLQDYFQTHDVQYIAEDGVFINMSTGEKHKGRAEIGALLHFMYHVAFDAKAEITNQIITENRALIEGRFKGKHIGEIAGIPATGKEVDVPLCVTYDLEEGLINEARIYMPVNILMEQLTT